MLAAQAMHGLYVKCWINFNHIAELPLRRFGPESAYPTPKVTGSPAISEKVCFS